MKGNDILEIIVADPTPIIRTGVAMTLKRISSLRVNIIEASSRENLDNCIKKYCSDIVIVNPSLGDGFEPNSLRNQHTGELKIVAIEVTPLPRQVVSQYDAVISIADDIPTIEKIISGLTTTTSEKSEEKESLSQRETEIVSLVVRGLTNKEIAEKLFLSVHTVITHRRNIARKLEIHSATGLTIYAIVNGIVDLSEVKI